MGNINMIYNLPFIDDEDAIGKWEYFDAVNLEEEFDAYNPKYPSQSRGFHEIYFLPRGEKYWIFEGWTKGLLFTHYGGDEPIICNKYKIIAINNVYFMLLEVQADDESYINILKKVSDRKFNIMEIGVRDNIDIPFTMDERIIGLWKSIDYVHDICDFSVNGSKPGILWLNAITFNNDGKAIREYSDETWYGSWTKGYLIDHIKKTASAYEVQMIDNINYLFLEWKMGNYVYGGSKPDYYVFRRVYPQ